MSDKQKEAEEDKERLRRAKQALTDDHAHKMQMRAEFNAAQQDLLNYRNNLKNHEK